MLSLRGSMVQVVASFSSRPEQKTQHHFVRDDRLVRVTTLLSVSKCMCSVSVGIPPSKFFFFSRDDLTTIQLTRFEGAQKVESGTMFQSCMHPGFAHFSYRPRPISRGLPKDPEGKETPTPSLLRALSHTRPEMRPYVSHTATRSCNERDGV